MSLKYLLKSIKFCHFLWGTVHLYNNRSGGAVLTYDFNYLFPIFVYTKAYLCRNNSMIGKLYFKR